MASSGRRPKAGISCPLSTRLANRQDDGAQRRRYAGNHSSRTKSRNRGAPERPSAVRGAVPRRSARAPFRASSTVMSAAGPTVALTGSPWTRPCQTKLRCPDGRTRTPRPDTSLSQTAYSVVSGFNLPTPASDSRTLRPFMPASPKGRETGSRTLRGPWRRTGGHISGWSPPSRDRAGGRRRARSRRRAARCWRMNA